MKWRDSDDRAGLGEKSTRDYLGDEDGSHWGKPGGAGPLSWIPASLKRYTPILTGAALFLIVLAVLKAIFNVGGSTDDARIRALEAKIINLEEKYGKFDSIDSKVTRIWEQAKSFENFRERFDRTEASMTLRMDHLATNIDSVQKRLVAADTHTKATRPVPSPRKTSASKKDKMSAAMRYHTVAPRETLYGISLKYGIDLDNLLKMNDMRKDTVIQPGQKLIVKR